MTEIRVVESVDIDVPVEEAYAYRLDFDNLPDYNPHVSDLRRTDGGDEPGAGAVYVFDIETPGAGTRPCTLTVLEAAPPGHIVNEMDSGIHAVETCTVTPNGAGSTVEIALTIFVPEGMDPQDLDPGEDNQVRLELDNMKRILEGG